MTETVDPILRAADLPPPTIAEAIELFLLADMQEKDPKTLKRVLRRARNKAVVDNVIALHGKTGDAEWEAAFTGALIRLESAAAFLREEVTAGGKPKRRKKKR